MRRDEPLVRVADNLYLDLAGGMAVRLGHLD